MPDISQKEQTDGFTRREKHKWFDKNTSQRDSPPKMTTIADSHMVCF